MDEEKKEQGRKCFVITPIGNNGSEIHRKAKGVIESVIKPVLKECGFDDVKPAYEINESGMIGNQIVGRIVNDDLVIANLTGNNPNVMYELAIRHATAKPIIHICENGTVLPFDIKDNRTIFYTNDMLGTQELSENFRKFVDEIEYSSEYIDNPIYNGMQMDALLRAMNSEGRKEEAYLLQTILDELYSMRAQYNNKSKNETSESVYDDLGFFEATVELQDDVREDLLNDFIGGAKGDMAISRYRDADKCVVLNIINRFPIRKVQTVDKVLYL